jgi:hypothetical protein
MQLQKLLKLQLLYLFLAVGWNIVAIVYVLINDPQTSPAQYLPNLGGLVAFLVFLAFGRFGYIGPYKVLMALYGVGCAYIGIIPWVVNLFNLESTFQLIPILTGASINIYGVSLCTITALGKFLYDK